MAPSRGGFPVRSPKPSRLALRLLQPYSQAVTALTWTCEIVVAVPFQPLGGIAVFLAEGVDQLRNASGKDGAWVGYPEAMVSHSLTLIGMPAFRANSSSCSVNGRTKP